MKEIFGLDTKFIGEHEGQNVMNQSQIPMRLNDESQQTQTIFQNTVIFQNDKEPEDEDESSEEDFEIEAAEQTLRHNGINFETQT